MENPWNLFTHRSGLDDFLRLLAGATVRIVDSPDGRLAADRSLLLMPPENNFQHQKREREFQLRVLRLLERPKRNKLLAFLNAPIFIWLISAIVLSLAPAIYQTRNRCIEYTDSAIIRELRTQSEINQRLIYFRDAVIKAKTAKELQLVLKDRKSAHEEFESKSLTNLLQDQGAYVSYIPLEDRLKLAEQTINSPRLIALAADADDTNISDETFNDLKKEVTPTTPTLPNFTMYISNCSILASIKSAIYGTHEYLRAIPFNQP